MRKLKHLPLEDWPAADREAFGIAYEPGDIFDDSRGPGAHHSEGWRRMILTTYRRWLVFLTAHHPADLLKAPVEDRITPQRIRDFIDHIEAEVRPTTVAMAIAHLHCFARLVAPTSDWRWLGSVKARLAARAKPEDRFDRLVPGWHTLDLGMEMMDEAAGLPLSRKQRDLHYRDGLLIALVSVWLIRRRSIAALTVTRHLEFDAAGMNILLFPEDTKAKRAESFRVPEELLPYLLRYLKEIRPRLLGRRQHDGLWASCKGCPLSGCRIYDIVRAHITAKFGKAMGLHDFRRAAATFIATDAPELIGLTPGVLQHASPDVAEQHYNLARSVEASRRFAAHVARIRVRLRPAQIRMES
jgi:integrase/recombinase XerD